VHLQVLIFDYDVHHGNGTADCFEKDPDVLFISSHQSGTLVRGGVGAGH
jgi:acetoin utilization deacetylase AcuC-like enzyme